MSKSVDELTVKRIVYETTLPVDKVIARLDEELSRDKAGMNVVRLLQTSKSREDIEQGLQNISGGNDFVLFASMKFHDWRAACKGTTDLPKMISYTFGNPLVAETMLQYDPFATLHVPLRLLVVEKADRSGTQVVYLQPSSVIVVPVDGKVNEDLQAAAEALDVKVERLMKKVTSV